MAPPRDSKTKWKSGLKPFDNSNANHIRHVKRLYETAIAKNLESEWYHLLDFIFNDHWKQQFTGLMEVHDVKIEVQVSVHPQPAFLGEVIADNVSEYIAAVASTKPSSRVTNSSFAGIQQAASHTDSPELQASISAGAAASATEDRESSDSVSAANVGRRRPKRRAAAAHANPIYTDNSDDDDYVVISEVIEGKRRHQRSPDFVVQVCFYVRTDDIVRVIPITVEAKRLPTPPGADEPNSDAVEVSLKRAVLDKQRKTRKQIAEQVAFLIRSLNLSDPAVAKNYVSLPVQHISFIGDWWEHNTFDSQTFLGHLPTIDLDSLENESTWRKLVLSHTESQRVFRFDNDSEAGIPQITDYTPGFKGLFTAIFNRCVDSLAKDLQDKAL